MCCISRPLRARGKRYRRSALAYGGNICRRIGVEELPELGLAVLRVPADARRVRAVNHRQEILRGGGAGRGRGCGCFVRRWFCRGRRCSVLQLHLRKWCAVPSEKGWNAATETEYRTSVCMYSYGITGKGSLPSERNSRILVCPNSLLACRFQI